MTRIPGSRSRHTLLVVAAATTLVLAGCSSPKSTGAADSGAGTGTASGSKAAAASCTPATMKTTKPGVITIGADNPVYEPWFSNNDPANGKGFESSVAYAIAQQLGYSTAKVAWKRVPFDSVVAGATHSFDFDLDEVSITPARAKAVDFSSGYYDVTQAIVTYKGSKIAGAKSIAALKKAKLGAQVGTTSYSAIVDQIKPSQQPAVYDTNPVAVQALKNHQIDGLVVDLPTAFYITSAQLSSGVIVGQLPVTGKPEQFGAVLTKGSTLTPCVTKAVNALRSNGTLAKLEDKWLTGEGAPKLS
ncbi:ABC transporter substrate-binding protein [Flexivirga caeni]|uniref:Amino acid ABC transporter substrate-binding protein n=1 Tax=Flexivirga caeni TaxID=2294115 RepID=A0A3M9MK05_9MICO|nr:ABC transporter substrate-binding protein [Flexivirga caeni]RNI25515.1 amino acid ABC transporter substrate-binding protein [Flexivirga caeni]